jgi:hypothetical protein
MKKTISFALILSLVLLVAPGSASAQQEAQTLRLGLGRNFGYGGMGKIQGNFTLRVIDPPPEVVEVQFYLDDELMGVVTEPPFELTFSTGQFEDGEHQLTARGMLEDGREMGSTTITQTFLSSEEAWAETQRLIIPLLLGVGALSLIGIGAPMLLGRKKKHIPGKYGAGGGAICSRCQLPFSRPFLAPNLVAGKLVRCPHCGKIGILPRASSANLQAAEKRFAGEEVSQKESSEQNDLKRLIEESRFEE